MPRRFQFDPKTHSYTLGGQPLPGVTGIIKAAGLMGSFLHGDEVAMERGSHVHEMTRLYDARDLDMDTLDPALVPYLESWKAFRKGWAPRIIEKERPRFNEAYGFAGTPDRLVEIKGMRYVLDIKSGAPAPWHVIQLAAYSFFWNPHPWGVAVYLKANGGKPVVKFHETDDFLQSRNRFIYAQDLHLWKIRNKVK